jgi:hypothetical protein
MAKTTNHTDQLAGLLLRSFRGAQQAANLSGQMLNTYGTVIDVADPEDLGRVRVILDAVNPDFLLGKDFEQAGEPTETDWIYPIVPFIGRQPEALVERMARVPLVPRDGDPNRLNFGDPVYDPNEFEDAEQPMNSAMTRLPVYPSGELPFATEENIGCMVIEENGPCDSDWLCVCLKRRGEYYWVRHIDLNHIHADQDDGKQPPDSAEDIQELVDEGPIWDLVAPTTDEAYSQQSYDPRDAGFFGGA